MKCPWRAVLVAGLISGCQNVREEVRDFLSQEKDASVISPEDEANKESYFTKDDNRPGLFTGEKGYFDITPGSASSDLPGSKKAKSKTLPHQKPLPEPSALEREAASSS